MYTQNAANAKNSRHEKAVLPGCCQDPPIPAAKNPSFHTARKLTSIVAAFRCRVSGTGINILRSTEYVLQAYSEYTGHSTEVWYAHGWLSVLRTQITVLVFVCVRSTYGCSPYRGTTLSSWIVLYSGVIRSPPPLFYRPAAFLSLLLASDFPLFYFLFSSSVLIFVPSSFPRFSLYPPYFFLCV